MVARRAFGRSLTVLGDLAQATSVAAPRNWASALRHLAHGTSISGRVCDLELGYRVPAPILEFANRLLPIAAPDVRPSRSVRTSGEPPSVIAVGEPGELSDEVVAQVSDLRVRYASVGVLAAPELVSELGVALLAAGVAFSVRMEEGVTLLSAVLAKGLEFDAVVVVEPSAIYDLPAGPSLLYVALTRAVQEVRIVHARELPEPLL